MAVINGRSGAVQTDNSTPGTTNAVTTRDSYAAAVSLTRPNDTTAYTAGDVIGPRVGRDGVTYKKLKSENDNESA